MMTLSMCVLTLKVATAVYVSLDARERQIGKSSCRIQFHFDGRYMKSFA